MNAARRSTYAEAVAAAVPWIAAFTCSVTAAAASTYCWTCRAGPGRQVKLRYSEAEADTYTSVLPAVAQAAAEAVAGIVPRAVPAAREPTGETPAGPGSDGQAAAALAGRYQPGPKTDTGRPPGRVNALVRGGAPSGTRTPNPLIKSQLLCQLS